MSKSRRVDSDDELPPGMHAYQGRRCAGCCLRVPRKYNHTHYAKSPDSAASSITSSSSSSSTLPESSRDSAATLGNSGSLTVSTGGAPVTSAPRAAVPHGPTCRRSARKRRRSGLHDSDTDSSSDGDDDDADDADDSKKHKVTF